MAVSTDKALYGPGEPVVVTWDGLGQPSDRIAIVPEGASDDTLGDWVYSDGTQVLPAAVVPAGSHAFATPAYPGGRFVARLLREQSWTIDAVQGGAYPANAAEWESWLAAHPAFSAFGVPSHVHNCQDASGGAVDTIGSDHLTESGSHTYGVTVPGYARKGIRITAGASQFLQSMTYNPNATSQLVIAVMGDPTTLAGRFFMQYGVNATIGTRLFTSGANLAIASGASTATGTAASSAIRPQWIQYARAAAVARGGDGIQALTPTYNASAAGALTAIGGVPSGASGGPVILYIVRWTGAASERSPSEIASLASECAWI